MPGGDVYSNRALQVCLRILGVKTPPPVELRHPIQLMADVRRAIGPIEGPYMNAGDPAVGDGVNHSMIRLNAAGAGFLVESMQLTANIGYFLRFFAPGEARPTITAGSTLIPAQTIRGAFAGQSIFQEGNLLIASLPVIGTDALGQVEGTVGGGRTFTNPIFVPVGFTMDLVSQTAAQMQELGIGGIELPAS